MQASLMGTAKDGSFVVLRGVEIASHPALNGRVLSAWTDRETAELVSLSNEAKVIVDTWSTPRTLFLVVLRGPST